MNRSSEAEKSPGRPTTDPRTSQRLGNIRQKGTAAELKVRRLVSSLGHRYRLNVRALSGTPDVSNRKDRWAIFVNGCYWHHHKGCHRATIPKSNRRFWKDKFAANRTRDARNVKTLRNEGFRVLLLWECELQNEPTALAKLQKFLAFRGHVDSIASKAAYVCRARR